LSPSDDLAGVRDLQSLEGGSVTIIQDCGVLPNRPEGPHGIQAVEPAFQPISSSIVGEPGRLTPIA